MKLDKETFIKEHFWFLLGLLVPLVLISLILLWATSSSIIAGQEKNVKDTKSKLQNIPNSQPKNTEWMKRLDERDNLADGQKKKIWEKAWNEQAGFMTWPEAFSKEFLDNNSFLDVLNKMYFGSEIPYGIRSKYDLEGVYRPQVYQAIEVVQPRDEYGRIVVQSSVPWEALIRSVPGQRWKSAPPSPEDMWLAQEDLWVQRGMLQIVRDANDMVATFKKKATDLKPEGGAKDRQVFTNPDWMLDLTLTRVENKPTLKCRLTNIGNRRESLGVYFLVGFKRTAQDEGTQHDLLVPEGEPLPPGKSMSFDRPLRLQVGDPSVVVSVKQLFDWRTVPVKRIDRLELGWFSNRHANKELLLAAFSKPKEGEQKDAPTNPLPQREGGEGLPAGPGGGGVGRPLSEGVTVNGLQKNRYIEVSEQLRRMPIGMALIVDQAHIQDVLTAVVNSPLRIQTTEVHWRRFHQDIKPRDEDKPAGSEKSPPRGGGEGVMAPRMPAGPGGTPAPALPSGGGFRPSSGMPERPGGLPERPGGMPFGPGRETGATSYVPDELEWDLVELAIYGIASIYERFPPPPPPAENTTGPVAGKTGQ